MEVKKWLKRGALGLGVAGAVAGGAVVAEKINQQDARIGELENKNRITVSKGEAQRDLNFLMVRNICRVTLLLGFEGDCDSLANGVIQGTEDRANKYLGGEIQEPVFVPEDAN